MESPSSHGMQPHQSMVIFAVEQQWGRCCHCSYHTHTHVFTLCRYIVRPYNFNVFPSTASSAVDKSFTAQVPLHNNTANSSSRLWLCNADPPPPLSPTRLPHCSSCRRTSLTLTSGYAKAFPFCHLTRKPRIELHGEQHTRRRTHTHTGLWHGSSRPLSSRYNSLRRVRASVELGDAIQLTKPEDKEVMGTIIRKVLSHACAAATSKQATKQGTVQPHMQRA